MLKLLARAFPPQPLKDDGRDNVDKIIITRLRYCGKGHDDRRSWEVAVTINGVSGEPKTLRDPFTSTEYKSYTKSTERRFLSDEQSQHYFGALMSQLNLECAALQGRPCCQISIHEKLDDTERGDCHIYSLFWEVLENVRFWSSRALVRVRLCRTWTYNAGKSDPVLQPSMLPAQHAEYRILLVIARSFRRDLAGTYQDYRPGLVLGPLLKVAMWCNGSHRLPKVRVDVVRPGTLDDLRHQLERDPERPYDILHLDMHGKIDKTTSSLNACLRFAKHYNENLGRFRKDVNPITELMQRDDSLSDVAVADIALLLQLHGVTNIALSSCFSSYTQEDMLANMCHVFLKHGAFQVSAMSFQVLEKTAQTYYAAFYEALLVNGQSFLSAAAVGRETLRADPDTNALVPTNYHRANKVSTKDFWPKHRMRLAWLRLVAAYCLRLGALVGVASAVAPLYSRTSWSQSRARNLGSLGLASMVLGYGSVRWVLPLQCPLWLWTPRLVKIFPPRGSLKTLSGDVEIEHLVLEDRLEFGASLGAIYLWTNDRQVELGGMVASLARVWVSTGFVDCVDIIPAAVFTSLLSNQDWYLRLKIARYKSAFTDGGGPPRKRLVAITDFDKFYDVYRRRSEPRSRDIPHVSGPALTELEDALWRMTGFLRRYEVSLPETATDANHDPEIRKPYLIVTGWYSASDWRRLTWRPEVLNIAWADTIGRAVPHLHGVQPSESLT